MELYNPSKKICMCKQCNKEYETSLASAPESTFMQKLNKVYYNDGPESFLKLFPIRDRFRIKKVCSYLETVTQDSLRTLDLSSRTWGFKNQRICEFLLYDTLQKCGSYLTRINLSEFQENSIDKNTLNMSVIIHFCAGLKEIEVNSIHVHKKDVKELTEKYSNLVKIDFGALYDDCDEELEELFKTNDELKCLKISSNSNLGKSLLCLPAQNMHTINLKLCIFQSNYLSLALRRFVNLRELKIFYCRNVPRNILKIVSTHCKNLTALHFVMNEPSIQTVNSLMNLPNLQILKVEKNTNISDEFLISLVRNCQQLTCLDISYCHKVTDIGLAALATLSKLKKLYISGLGEITGDGLQNICGLEELFCNCCLSLTDENMSMLLISSPHLRLLDVSRTNITDVIISTALEAVNSRHNNVRLRINVTAATMGITSGRTRKLSHPLLQFTEFNNCKSSEDND